MRREVVPGRAWRYGGGRYPKDGGTWMGEVGARTYSHEELMTNPTTEDFALVVWLLGAVLQKVGPVELPPTWREEIEAAGVATGWEYTEDGGVVVALVNIEGSPEAEAVKVATGGWLHAESGRAVQVDRVDHQMVYLRREIAPDKWSEEEQWHADCFLRDHVLASGVPLLG